MMNRLTWQQRVPIVRFRLPKNAHFCGAYYAPGVQSRVLVHSGHGRFSNDGLTTQPIRVRIFAKSRGEGSRRNARLGLCSTATSTMLSASLRKLRLPHSRIFRVPKIRRRIGGVLRGGGKFAGRLLPFHSKHTMLEGAEKYETARMLRSVVQQP